MMAFVISAIIAGQIVGRFGRYWPFLLLGPIPLGIGAGILYTITETSSSSLLIGLQILVSSSNLYLLRKILTGGVITDGRWNRGNGPELTIRNAVSGFDYFNISPSSG